MGRAAVKAAFALIAVLVFFPVLSQIPTWLSSAIVFHP